MAQNRWIASGGRAAGVLIFVTASASACVPVPEWVPPATQAAAPPQDAAVVARMHAAVAGMEREASQQVKRCYRSPRVATNAKQISTTLRARYGPDGTLASLPETISQSGITPANQIYARRMAEAASMAVLKCAPIRVPQDSAKGGFTIMDFTFSPVARG
jgi:hypothetical protein